MGADRLPDGGEAQVTETTHVAGGGRRRELHLVVRRRPAISALDGAPRRRPAPRPAHRRPNRPHPAIRPSGPARQPQRAPRTVPPAAMAVGQTFIRALERIRALPLTRLSEKSAVGRGRRRACRADNPHRHGSLLRRGPRRGAPSAQRPPSERSAVMASAAMSIGGSRLSRSTRRSGNCCARLTHERGITRWRTAEMSNLIWRRRTGRSGPRGSRSLGRRGRGTRSAGTACAFRWPSSPCRRSDARRSRRRPT